MAEGTPTDRVELGAVDTRSVLGMRRFWDEAARRNAAWYVDTSIGYDDSDMDRFRETGRKVVAHALDDAPVAPTDRHLAVEIGCGLGRNCVALADRFERVIGLDISSEMVGRARELVTDPRVSFMVGDGLSLRPLDDASADLVLSFTVFQHMPRFSIIESYLRDAGRVLRPGGVLVFQWNNEPGAWRWRARRAVLSTMQHTGVFAERYGRNASEFLGSRVPLRHVARALRSSGFAMRGATGEGTLFAWAWAERL